MNKSSSNNTPNKTTADCPYCGYRNTVDKYNLLYFCDTLVPRGIHCNNCGQFVSYEYFIQATDNNLSTMHG